MSSTNLEMGIVGLPNVGKSTLFNAITKAGAEAANYPFCTIEPNVGIVDVPDPRPIPFQTHCSGGHEVCRYCRPCEGRLQR